jgi:hypothetical protein
MILGIELLNLVTIYIFHIEELRRVMNKKKNVVNHGLVNRNRVIEDEEEEEKESNKHSSIYQIIKIEDTKLTLKDIITDIIYSVNINLKKERAYVGAGMCPHYTKIMTGNFPIIEEITDYKIETNDFCYEEEYNRISLIDEEGNITEYILTQINEEIKQKLKTCNQVTVLKCYNSKNKNNCLLLTKIIEIINK